MIRTKEVVIHVGSLINHLPNRGNVILSKETRENIVTLAINEFLWSKLHVIPAGFSISNPPVIHPAHEAICAAYKYPQTAEGQTQSGSLYWGLMNKIETCFREAGYCPMMLDRVAEKVNFPDLGFKEGYRLPVARVFDHGVVCSQVENRPQYMRFSWRVPVDVRGRPYSVQSHVKHLLKDIERLKCFRSSKDLILNALIHTETQKLSEAESLYDEYVNIKRY